MFSSQTRQAISQYLISAIAKERLRQGLSMNRLAEMTGLSLSMISYVERGLRNPTLDTLIRITSALNLDLGKIIREAVKATGSSHSKG